MIDMTDTVTDQQDRLWHAQLALPGTPPAMSMPTRELAALIEALLLVASEPPTIHDLAGVAGVEPDRIEHALLVIDERESRGVIVQRHGDRVQLTTAPRFSNAVRLFLKIDREVRLSSASLETLAIVAYQQPVTRAGIESVRGVDCSGVLSTLHARGLIEPVSRLASVGTPIQYGTSVEFLQHFGLGSLADLPPLGAINGLDGRTALEAAANPPDQLISPDAIEASPEMGNP